VIIGASRGFAGNGAAYVVFGKDGGFASSIDVRDLDGSDGFRLTGTTGSLPEIA
jgi:hypothetical protein